ncbi:MAG: Gfo/Idh/MocA family protein, partial [Bacilli bacterium]
MIKFGIVGLGRLGFFHANNLANKLENVQLVALCSLDKQANERFKKTIKEDVLIFEDYELMLKEAPLDAILICSPSSSHAHHLKLALSYNLHVFCEKPIALYEEELDELRN